MQIYKDKGDDEFMKDYNTFSLLPCNKCGKYQQNVGKSLQTKFLDRGDSTYVHFDEVTNLCKIYKDRPLICRVEDYYETYLTNQYSQDEFVKINLYWLDQLN